MRLPCPDDWRTLKDFVQRLEESQAKEINALIEIFKKQNKINQFIDFRVAKAKNDLGLDMNRFEQWIYDYMNNED